MVNNLLDVPFLTEEECDQIKSFAYKLEEDLIKDGFGEHQEHVAYDNVLTSNYFRYNVIHYFPHLADKLADCLNQIMHPQNLEWPIAVQAWCNIYRKGQGIEWHNHMGQMGRSWTANIFIDGPEDSHVVYKEFNAKAVNMINKKGHMHLLPCELFHMVPKNQTDTDRITLGLTIHSYPVMQKTFMDRYAFNSKTYQDTVVLTREHLIHEKHAEG